MKLKILKSNLKKRVLRLNLNKFNPLNALTLCKYRKIQVESINTADTVISYLEPIFTL